MPDRRPATSDGDASWRCTTTCCRHRRAHQRPRSWMRTGRRRLRSTWRLALARVVHRPRLPPQRRRLPRRATPGPAGAHRFASTTAACSAGARWLGKVAFFAWRRSPAPARRRISTTSSERRVSFDYAVGCRRLIERPGLMPTHSTRSRRAEDRREEPTAACARPRPHPLRRPATGLVEPASPARRRPRREMENGTSSAGKPWFVDAFAPRNRRGRGRCGWPRQVWNEVTSPSMQNAPTGRLLRTRHGARRAGVVRG